MKQNIKNLELLEIINTDLVVLRSQRDYFYIVASVTYSYMIVLFILTILTLKVLDNIGTLIILGVDLLLWSMVFLIKNQIKSLEQIKKVLLK